MTAAFPHRRSRRWIGFFVVLAVLSAGAIVVNLVYNLSIQLRPEQLADARRRWQENGPDNYDLEYLVEIKQKSDVEPEKSQYLVKVRDGRVVFVADTGEVLYLDPSLALVAGSEVLAVSSENPGQYGVPALLDQIAEGLRQDEMTGRRNFATAQFDPMDGHPTYYRRSVRGRKDRVEWFVKFKRIK
ncbi:MAG: hypothetical protein ACRELF_12870 [Gemmataceae bacterium]